ncbi:unnamed protein product, partial [Prorocentrum cordatum]
HETEKSTGNGRPSDGQRSPGRASRARDRSDDAQDLWQEVSAAALVAGTAIGGGFLALPYTTAPAGAAPSAALLACSWAFLLAQALVVADLVVDASEEQGSPTGVLGVARSTLGGPGAAFVSVAFLSLMMCTLVSQFSKAGALLAPALHLQYAAGCVGAAAVLGAFEAASPAWLVASANAALTACFVAAAAGLFAGGAPLADWGRLARADWGAAPAALPSVLQLLVFAEVVPAVCSLLAFRPSRIRRALVAGSALLLAVQLGWSCLGIGLAPFAGHALRRDPLDALPRAGLGPAALPALGACAISTTVVGTSIALRSFFADAQGGREAGSPRASRAVLLFLAVASCIAATSPEAFFGAIDLAGAYPVVLLWGVAPPVMRLVQGGARRGRPRSASCFQGGRRGLQALAAASGALVLFNVSTDLASLLTGGAARWQ